MPAFVIIELSIHDKEGIVEYQKLAPATIAQYDGKFVVRGGQTTSLEGNWNPQRIVVIEFPSVQRAKEWWDSEMYSKAKALRQKFADTKMIIVEGYN
jgi:uncharacterized protein (DUF1330 family)